jgi:hypothetical protein
VEGRTVHSPPLSLAGAHATGIEVGAATTPGHPGGPVAKDRRPGFRGAGALAAISWGR